MAAPSGCRLLPTADEYLYINLVFVELAGERLVIVGHDFVYVNSKSLAQVVTRGVCIASLREVVNHTPSYASNREGRRSLSSSSLE